MSLSARVSQKKQSAHLVQMAEVQSLEPAASVNDLCTAGGAAGITARLKWTNTLLASNPSAFKMHPWEASLKIRNGCFFSDRVFKHTHHYLWSQNLKELLMNGESWISALATVNHVDGGMNNGRGRGKAWVFLLNKYVWFFLAFLAVSLSLNNQIWETNSLILLFAHFSASAGV